MAATLHCLRMHLAASSAAEPLNTKQSSTLSPGVVPHLPLGSRHTMLRLQLAIVVVCALAIAALWRGTLERITQEREQALAAAMESNANLAVAFEQQVFRTLKAAEQVTAFVRDQYLEHGSSIDLKRWVDEQLIRDALFTIVNVVDAQGNIVVSSNQMAGKVNYADRVFFQAQQHSTEDTLYVSAPVLGRVSGKWQIPMSLRISHADGRFGGVVVLSVSPYHFTQFYQDADLGAQGLLELTGLDGTVRSRTVGGQDSFGLPAADLPWFQRSPSAPASAFSDSGAALDQVARIVSYRNVGGYPLLVTVGTALAAELAPVEQRRQEYLWMSGATTAALVVIAGLLQLILARQRAATQALRASEALFRATFSQAAMGIAHIALDGRILGANQRFCRMLDYSLEELHSRSVLDLCDAEHRPQAQQFLTERLHQTAPTLSPEIEKPYLRKDGSTLWVCEALSVVTDDQGQPAYLVAVMQDITVRKHLEKNLSYAALHDGLTLLPNRVMFLEQLAERLAQARLQQEQVVVLFLDLDGFKAVNDNLGHAAGDELLCQAAPGKLPACGRHRSTPGRGRVWRGAGPHHAATGVRGGGTKNHGGPDKALWRERRAGPRFGQRGCSGVPARRQHAQRAAGPGRCRHVRRQKSGQKPLQLGRAARYLKIPMKSTRSAYWSCASSYLFHLCLNSSLRPPPTTPYLPSFLPIKLGSPIPITAMQHSCT